MTDMVERVARAMAERQHEGRKELCAIFGEEDLSPLTDDTWRNFEDMARVALEAMKGVSNAVAFAGAEKARELDRDPKCILRAEACAEVFDAMIAAALKPTPPKTEQR